MAGLAAAAALGERGVPVTLLESRPRLGGRASSFIDRATDTAIDNCQHVSLGCCTNFQHFCETVGMADLFRREGELYFIGRDGRVNTVKADRLPAPLHLARSFHRLSYLSRDDLAGIARGLKDLARTGMNGPASGSFAAWLTEHGQTQAAVDRFWHVVLVSALSESLDRISVAAARKVFTDTFLANRHGWQVVLPTVPLDELYGGRLRTWLEDHGATIRLQAGVQRILTDGEEVAGVELRSGERLPAEHVILAVPHHRLLPLLPESIRADSALRSVEQLETAPISSVHLWFDRLITGLPHAVLIDRLSQWLFNRTALQSGKPRAESREPRGGNEPATKRESADNSRLSPLDPQLHYYQVVISASRNLSGMSSQDVIHEVVRELQGIWPEAAQAELVHARLVTEHKAVFSPQPGADALRPPQQSPIANLQLAGDWTATGWPATMEGAVRSGYLAAGNVLAQKGRPDRLLQPDLPAALLSRLLLGL